MTRIDTTLGLDAARAADPAAYALGGVAPRRAVRPRHREEVAEAMRAANREGLAVVPWGGGVALAHEAAPPRYDLAIDLGGLDRIVEYDPEDFTLTAECGVTIDALRAALAARGQELPLEAAGAARATLGGVLAADASGPRRLRFGAPHDRILGARFVLADGTLVRSGGQVVKNVAGYGTHRLLCGSRGALAAFVEASLKLAPAPRTRVAMCFGADQAEIANTARWSGFPRLEVSLLSVVAGALAAGLPVRAGAPFTVVLGLEDEPAWVGAQESAAFAALGTPMARLTGAEAAGLWQSLADLEETPGPRLTFTTAASTPAALAPLLARRAATRFVFHATAGRLHLFPEDPPATEEVEAIEAQGFKPIAVRGLAGSLTGSAPTVAMRALRGRIRAGLDPGGTFALGAPWAGSV